MESKQNNKLGIKIKLLSQKAELSQDELARKLDVAYTTLTKIETGIIRSPSVFIVGKISKILAVNIEDLLK